MVWSGIEKATKGGNEIMENMHECNALEKCEFISIEKVQGRWMWIFHKKKKTEAHGIKFCPYCGDKLEGDVIPK